MSPTRLKGGYNALKTAKNHFDTFYLICQAKKGGGGGQNSYCCPPATTTTTQLTTRPFGTSFLPLGPFFGLVRLSEFLQLRLS